MTAGEKMKYEGARKKEGKKGGNSIRVVPDIRLEKLSKLVLTNEIISIYFGRKFLYYYLAGYPAISNIQQNQYPVQR